MLLGQAIKRAWQSLYNHTSARDCTCMFLASFASLPILRNTELHHTTKTPGLNSHDLIDVSGDLALLIGQLCGYISRNQIVCLFL